MNIDGYTLLVFAHVLLFAYWLGPDWGVYVCARRVADESLTREERMRFLKASVAVDVVPRTAIVLIIAVGFTLSWWGGYLQTGALPVVLWWLVSACWVGLVWATGYLLPPGPLRSRLDSLHMALRHAVTAFLVGLGTWALVTGAPIASAWLALKLVLVGFLLAGGSALRVIVAGWLRELTAPEGSEALELARGSVIRTYPRARWLAYLFWATTISIAFLGVTKPF